MIQRLASSWPTARIANSGHSQVAFRLLCATNSPRNAAQTPLWKFPAPQRSLCNRLFEKCNTTSFVEDSCRTTVVVQQIVSIMQHKCSCGRFVSHNSRCAMFSAHCVAQVGCGTRALARHGHLSRDCEVSNLNNGTQGRSECRGQICNGTSCPEFPRCRWEGKVWTNAQACAARKHGPKTRTECLNRGGKASSPIRWLVPQSPFPAPRLVGFVTAPFLPASFKQLVRVDVGVSGGHSRKTPFRRLRD